MRRRRACDGHVLVLALFVLLVVTLASALLAQVLAGRQAMQRREVVRVKLDLLVDGVVADTLAQLARDPAFTGVSRVQRGPGEVWSTVRRGSEGDWGIEAGARLGASQRGVRVKASPAVAGPRIVSWARGALARRVPQPFDGG